jgi:hypothetical protein
MPATVPRLLSLVHEAGLPSTGIEGGSFSDDIMADVLFKLEKDVENYNGDGLQCNPIIGR